MNPAIQCVSTFEHKENIRIDQLKGSTVVADVQSAGNIFSSVFTIKYVRYAPSTDLIVLMGEDKNKNYLNIQIDAEGFGPKKSTAVYSINGVAQDYLKLECGLKD